MALLDIDKLTIRFGGLTAVNQFDFRVEQGSISSVIGPNGAGKTTVFNAVTGIYEPTSGAIRFEGHELSRPHSWRVWLGFALVGLFTGLAVAAIAADIDRLWRAAINRNVELGKVEPTRPFNLAAAGRGAWEHLRGKLAIEKQRRKGWSIVSTYDSQDKSLGIADTYEDALRLQADLEQVIGMTAASVAVEPRDGQWQVMAPDGSRPLLSFSSEDQAQRKLAALTELGKDRKSRVRWTWLALLAGLAGGSAAAYAVWQRSRRTTDVISLGGIARTFQNIRLFQNMTVLENVLVGLDRTFPDSVVRMMLRTPGLRPGLERAGVNRAVELLEFVGLADQRRLLAKNLPYGDQRRLEIARALATGPRLLLLDEPAAGMNPSESHELMGLIRKIREQGVTVLLIEHHMKLVMDISDRIAVLDYGSKIAEGPPAEVRANPKVIEAYLGKEDVS